VRELASQHPIALVNSVNEFRVEGQKTAAFEIAEDLDDQLDAHCIPVGNAGNVTAYWRGFRELGLSPKMFGFQAAGAAPLVAGKPIEHPETVASAIRIGNPARWEQGIGRFGGGLAHARCRRCRTRGVRADRTWAQRRRHRALAGRRRDPMRA
jgi:threonine synthase